MHLRLFHCICPVYQIQSKLPDHDYPIIPIIARSQLFDNPSLNQSEANEPLVTPVSKEVSYKESLNTEKSANVNKQAYDTIQIRNGKTIVKKEPKVSNTRKKVGRKTNFAAEEENQLIKLVSIYGENKWSKISSIMTKWDRKQLRDHYVNFVKYNRDDQYFTPEDDKYIMEFTKNHGRSWINIAKNLPGKSPMAIKNRYYKKLIKDSIKHIEENQVDDKINIDSNDSIKKMIKIEKDDIQSQEVINNSRNV